MTTQADPLREALENYGEHRSDCPAFFDAKHECICGLSAALSSPPLISSGDMPAEALAAGEKYLADLMRPLGREFWWPGTFNWHAFWKAMHVPLAQSPAPQGEARDPRVERMATHCCVPELDEPFFVLLGRDPQAPGLVEKWAQDRAQVEPGDKAVSAYATAKFMRMWKDAHPERGLSMQEFAKIAAPQSGGMREALGHPAKLMPVQYSTCYYGEDDDEGKAYRVAIRGANRHFEFKEKHLAEDLVTTVNALAIPSDRTGREEEIARGVLDQLRVLSQYDEEVRIEVIATALRQSASAGIERAAEGATEAKNSAARWQIGLERGDWKPTRAHIEAARKSFNKISELLRPLSSSASCE